MKSFTHPTRNLLATLTSSSFATPRLNAGGDSLSRADRRHPNRLGRGSLTSDSRHYRSRVQLHQEAAFAVGVVRLWVVRALARRRKADRRCAEGGQRAVSGRTADAPLASYPALNTNRFR